MLKRSIRIVLGLSFCLFAVNLTGAKDRPQPAAGIHLDRDGEKWAAKTLRKMSLEEKIGQLIMPWARVQFLNAKNPEYLLLREDLRKYHVGGFAVSVPVDGPFLLYNEPYGTAALTNKLQHDSKQPLIFAADFERALPCGCTEPRCSPTPWHLALRAAGICRGSRPRDCGRVPIPGHSLEFLSRSRCEFESCESHHQYAVIGEDPQQVGDLVAAYIRGAHAEGMLVTAKHFPGHGDTGTDSHLGVAQVTGDAARLDSVEMPPFRQALTAGVDAVMVAHVSVPSLEPDPKRVATTSPKSFASCFGKTRLSRNCDH